KVRYIGSSTFPPEDIVEAQWVAERRGRERFVCEQPPYSIFARGVEAGVLPTCARYRMGVIVWSPLAGGWLTGNDRRDQPLPEGSRAAVTVPSTPFRRPPTPVTSVDAYRAIGGGSGLDQAARLGPAQTVKELTLSGLRGRGGGGFPTGRKWTTILNATGTHRFVVAN